MSVLMRIDGGYVYGPHAIPRRQKPVLRVRLAMRRLSRNRWLMPHEVQRIGFRLSQLCSGKPHKTFEAAVSGSCLYIGMVNGIPPAAPWEKDRYTFLRQLCLDNMRFEALAKELSHARVMEETQ